MKWRLAIEICEREPGDTHFQQDSEKLLMPDLKSRMSRMSPLIFPLIFRGFEALLQSIARCIPAFRFQFGNESANRHVTKYVAPSRRQCGRFRS